VDANQFQKESRKFGRMSQRMSCLDVCRSIASMIGPRGITAIGNMDVKFEFFYLDGS